VIGAHPCDADNRCLWGGLDFDNHDKNPETAEANLKAAKRIHRRLVRMGFHPLLTDEGDGNYHLLVFFRKKASGRRFHFWLKSLVAPFLPLQIEVFPKQEDVRDTPKGYGNWLRLPGRHHKRPHWSRVWDGEKWLEWTDARPYLLTLTGDSRKLLPSAPDSPQKRDQKPKKAHFSTSIRLGKTWDDLSRLRYTPNLVAYTDAEQRTLIEAAKAHLPKRPGERNAKHFAIARAIYLIRDDLTESQVAEVFRMWWPLAVDVVKNKDETYNLSEFIRAYFGVKWKGLDWPRILDEAKREPLPDWSDWYTENMKALARLCARLQREAGDGAFFLGYDVAASKLGFSKATAQGAFRIMMRKNRDGTQLLERMTVGDNIKKKASTYLYLPMWTEDGEYIGNQVAR
jgi:hypothetical protein